MQIAAEPFGIESDVRQHARHGLGEQVGVAEVVEELFGVLLHLTWLTIGT
jgi:hypothetical protein